MKRERYCPIVSANEDLKLEIPHGISPAIKYYVTSRCTFSRALTPVLHSASKKENRNSNRPKSTSLPEEHRGGRYASIVSLSRNLHKE